MWYTLGLELRPRIYSECRCKQYQFTWVDDICTTDDIACLNRPNHQVSPGKWPKITITFVSFIAMKFITIIFNL